MTAALRMETSTRFNYENRGVCADEARGVSCPCKYTAEACARTSNNKLASCSFEPPSPAR